jgi:hypothetical protein
MAQTGIKFHQMYKSVRLGAIVPNVLQLAIGRSGNSIFQA